MESRQRELLHPVIGELPKPPLGLLRFDELFELAGVSVEGAKGGSQAEHFGGLPLLNGDRAAKRSSQLLRDAENLLGVAAGPRSLHDVAGLLKALEDVLHLEVLDRVPVLLTSHLLHGAGKAAP